jgi:2-polyprenylphenol 6-hydroxylase
MGELTHDIIIVGAGVIGQALANTLAGAGMQVALIERHTLTQSAVTDDFDPKVYALNHESQRLLTAIDCWPQLARHAVFHDMTVWDERGGGNIHFSCQDVAKSSLGHIVEDKVLAQAIFSCSQAQPQIDLYSNHQLTELMVTNDAATLTSGAQQWRAKLLIGADGGRSWVRQQADIACHQWDYRQQAIVAVVKTQQAHHHVARQCFTKSGPLAWLPLPDKHHCVIVFSSSEFAYYSQLTDAAFNDYLSDSSITQLGDTQLVSQRMMFPLMMRHARQYTQHRLALVGDAVRTIHPLAGQGMNYGLQDVASLAEIILQHYRAKRDYGAKHNLRAYERARKAASWQVITMMEGFKQLFTRQAGPWVVTRSLGLTLVDRLPWIKNQFITRGLGA